MVVVCACKCLFQKQISISVAWHIKSQSEILNMTDTVVAPEPLSKIVWRVNKKFDQSSVVNIENGQDYNQYQSPSVYSSTGAGENVNIAERYLFEVIFFLKNSLNHFIFIYMYFKGNNSIEDRSGRKLEAIRSRYRTNSLYRITNKENHT